MFRRRITLVLALFALVMALAALLAAASLAVTERQVLRGRVASDIATGFIQLSAQKQRLRTWVAQMQQGAHADSGARAELLAAMQGTLQRLKVLTQQAIELDGSAEAREEHLRRRETLVVLERSVAALAQAVDRVRPLEPGADAPQAWEALSRVFDMPQGHDVRRLIAENIARETAAVQRERAAADATLAWVRWLWLGAAAIVSVSAMAAALHFGRALHRPLQQLSEGARALQAGRLGHRIALAGQDEFAEVAGSVNALAAELEQHRERESAQRQRLEVQVDTRTRELADALASLHQADAQRRRLFADISHELRTPTTVIRGEAEITLRGRDKPASEYKEALSRIVSTARQLGAVIDDLLAMARSVRPPFPRCAGAQAQPRRQRPGAVDRARAGTRAWRTARASQQCRRHPCGADTAPPCSPAPGHRMNILIIEDDPRIADFLGRGLRAERGDELAVRDGELLHRELQRVGVFRRHVEPGLEDGAEREEDAAEAVEGVVELFRGGPRERPFVVSRPDRHLFGAHAERVKRDDSRRNEQQREHDGEDSRSQPVHLLSPFFP